MKKILPTKSIITLMIIFAFFGVPNIHAGFHKNASVLQSNCGSVEVVPIPSTGTYNDEIEVLINISNNQCELSALGFDLHFDASKFSFLGTENQNCVTMDWSMLDGHEISPGRIRIGGLAGTGTSIQSGQNGSLVKVRFRVSCQCGVCSDGQQTSITIDSYVDHMEAFLPQPAQGTFTFSCCCGSISLPIDKEGTWGNLIHIPVNIANNMSQICDFEYDFVYDPSVLEFVGIEKSAATQNWSTMDWNPIEVGKVRITGKVGSGTCIPTRSSVILCTMAVMVQCVRRSSDTPVPIRIEEFKDGIFCVCPRFFEADFLYRPRPRLGDVNGDGTITPGDAQVTFEIYLGLVHATQAQLTTADTNCSCPCEGKEHIEANNCLTPWDAQWIFDHYLGMRDLPLCCGDHTCGNSSVNSNTNNMKPTSEKRVVYPLPTIANSRDRVLIPVMINDPGGVRNFGFEMYYPQDLLEYKGTLATPLTRGLVHVSGEEDIPGVVRIKGIGDTVITTQEAGSLSVVVFHVRDGVAGSANIVLSNLTGDIFDAEAGSSTFLYGNDLIFNERSLHINQGKKSGELLVLPVEVSGAFGMNAFGLELKYSPDKMTFLGVESTELTKDFLAVKGNELTKGVVRIGGYSMSGIQDMSRGILVKLIFLPSEYDGTVEIIRVDDDLKDFLIIR